MGVGGGGDIAMIRNDKRVTLGRPKELYIQCVHIRLPQDDHLPFVPFSVVQWMYTGSGGARVNTDQYW